MKMDLQALQIFLAEQFPQGARFGQIEAAGDGWAHFRLPISDEHLRPGATVSGPSLMALADVALYGALLSRIGPVALAVTINLNINFLRKPSPERDILAKASMLKVGRRLGMGEVYLYSEGNDDPVAHATLTYSIPEH
ncbi:PaaI family thioesterase [Nitrincola alkalilacustris]|uniref:PaaI family thioesterase n=1 Tax=Nitrincola alkalilacustris TaxID=1571224 RepID=UPI00124DE795|nr:PaaI family thioesterase [Nitrincola alkalilacustris]